MLLKALVTIFRKPNLQKDLKYLSIYNNQKINKKQFAQFCDFFETKTLFPNEFYYLIAQKLHIQTMLKKNFPLPLPGLIHIYNKLNIHQPIDINSPFDVEISTIISRKNNNSFLTVLKTYVKQKNEEIATMESGYLFQKKNVKSPFRKQLIQLISSPEYSEPITFSKNEVKKYILLSGDYNPIHINRFMAKMFGFKQPIVHGWLAVSKVMLSSKKINWSNNLSCTFQKPVYIDLPYRVLYSENKIQCVQNKVVCFEISFL